MTVKTLCITALTVVLLAGAVHASEPPLKEDEKWVEATEAPAETVKTLLEKHRKAVAAKEAEPLCEVLKEMLPFNNARFRDPALKALKYRAGTADRKAVYKIAKERSITKPKRIQAMIAQREERVQALAARMIANFPGNASTKLLHRMFADKKILGDKPLVAKEVIISMARLGYTKVWKDVQSEFRKFRDPEIMRASVIYFGLTKEKRVAKMLTDHIDEPAPGNVNSGSNPPASYWKARWEAWENIKDVVQWALKEITGYEGEFHSSKQARDYIKDHGRELGIR